MTVAGKTGVSVIMGVFNGACFVNKAVESILAQTFEDLEFLVVDDGSTDETPEILCSFSDSRLRVVRQDRQGLTAALIAAASRTNGRYIARQDADDISEPGRLAAQVEYLERRSEVVLVGTWASVIDENGDVIGHTAPETEPGIHSGGLRQKNQFVHGSILMRREAYDAVGGYRSPFRYAQDYDLVLRMAERGRLANLPCEYYRHRMRPEMISMREHRRQLWYRDVARRLHEERRLHGEDRLVKGQGIAEPEELESTVAGEMEAASERYRSTYIYTCLRHGKVRQARRALREAIASQPFQVRSYASYISTLFGGSVTRSLYRVWDRWRESP